MLYKVMIFNLTWIVNKATQVRMSYETTEVRIAQRVVEHQEKTSVDLPDKKTQLPTLLNINLSMYLWLMPFLPITSYHRVLWHSSLELAKLV